MNELDPLSGEEIKAFRKQVGLSQAALAEAAGFSARAVQDWEGGRRTPPVVLRLAFAAINRGIKPWVRPSAERSIWVTDFGNLRLPPAIEHYAQISGADHFTSLIENDRLDAWQRRNKKIVADAWCAGKATKEIEALLEPNL